MGATYRIGPADHFTGGDLKGDAVTLNSQVQATDDVIGNVPQGDNRLSEGLFQAWATFTAIWNPYFADTYQNSSGFDNFLTALNDGNRDQLVQFENRFADLYQQFKSAGITSPAVDVAVSLGAPDTVTALIASIDAAARRLLPFGLGLGAFLVLAVVVWYFVLPRLAMRAA